MSGRANGGTIWDVSDQVATRYGVLGRDLSIAVLQVIVLASHEAVNALNDVCLHAARMDALPPSFTSSPLSRWQELLGNLFPTEILIVDSEGSPSPDLAELPATEAEQRAIRRLLGAAASFLLSASATVDEVITLAEVTPTAHAILAQEARSQARLATAASDLLLDHAEAGSWRALLATFVEDQTPAAQEVPAADVLPRDREFPPVVVSFDDGHAEAKRWWDGRQRSMLVVDVVGLRREGKSRLVEVLKDIAVDQEDWSFPVSEDDRSLDMLSQQDATPTCGPLAIRDLAWDTDVWTSWLALFHWYEANSDARTPQFRSRLAAAMNMLRRHELTARIADLVVRVGPDIAPVVGTAFRALATASIGGDIVASTACRTVSDPGAVWARELKLLHAFVSHGHPPEKHRRVRLASLCWLLPDDLHAATIVAIANGCSSAVDTVSQQLECDPGRPEDGFAADSRRAQAPVSPDSSFNAGPQDTAGSRAQVLSEESRPWVKQDHRPVRSCGRQVHLGGVVSGIQRSVPDPDGLVWALLAVLDGTRTVDQVVSSLAQTFPDRTADEVRAVIHALVRAGYVEDAGAVDVSTTRESERVIRAQALFRWMDGTPRSSGRAAQVRLRQARVVVVGVGGVGSSAALALAQAGIGELHLVEPDVVTVSNLNRQALFTEWDLGRPKVDVVVERLRELNCQITVTGEAVAVTGPAILAELAARCDLLVLAVDHPRGIRSWTNFACAQTKTAWVHSGFHGAHVTVGLYRPDTGPCYDCTSLEGNDYPDELLPRPSTDTGPPGATAVTAGVAGQLAAHAACSLLTGVPQLPANREYEFNLATLDNNTHSIDARRPDCPTCGQKASSSHKADPHPAVVDPLTGLDILARSVAQSTTPSHASRPSPTGSINWNACTHEQLYRWLHDADASRVSSIAHEWHWQSTELADIARGLHGQRAALRQNWSGQAAERAVSRLAELAKRLADSSNRAASVGNVIEQSWDALCEARAAMPPPLGQPRPGDKIIAAAISAVTGGSDSMFRAIAEAAAAGKARAVTVMQQYEAALTCINPPRSGASAADDEHVNRLSGSDQDLVDTDNDAFPVIVQVRGRDRAPGEVIAFAADEVNAQIIELAAVGARICHVEDSVRRLAEGPLLLGTAPPAVHLARRLQEATSLSGLPEEIRAANAELASFVAALKASAAMYLDAEDPRTGAGDGAGYCSSRSPRR